MERDAMLGTIGPVLVLSVMPGVNPSAGAEQSFAVTAPGLVDRGVRLHLVIFTERQGLVPQLERAGVVVHDLSSSRTILGRTLALRRVISRICPDLVHATLWDAVVPAQLVSICSRVPLLVTWANVRNLPSGMVGVSVWKHRLVDLLDRTLAKASRCWFHAVTDGVAAANAAALDVPHSRVRVVERGRAEIDAPTDGHTLEALRSELDLPTGARVVLAVGRQEAVKDQVALIEAVSAVARQVPGVRLLIAGREGNASPAIRRALSDPDLAARVKLLGQRDDVAALLEIADVFALSSRSEGAAGGVIEAMRAGCPILATDVVGQRGILVDDVNARVVPIGDAAAMATALVELLDDHAFAKRLGNAARATYLDRFTLERAVSNLYEAYCEIASTSR